MKKEFSNNIRAMPSPPSPVPTKKKSRKTLLLILLALILIVIIVVGAFIAMGGLGNNNSTTTPTPTPTPAPGTTSTPAPSSITGANIAGATSLQYTVAVTSGGVSQGSYTYYGKNAGTANFMMRIDYTDGSGAQGAFIINSAQQKAWSYSDGTWTDVSAAYTTQYNTWNTLWQGYVNSLGAWTGLGDYTYSSGGDSVTFSGISVNPSLPDSLFTPS